MFKRLVIIALFLSAALAVPVRGASTVGWTRIETQNFEFVGDAPEASIRTAADRLERFREALAEILQLPARTSKTRVIVFMDSASFRAFKPRRTDGTPDDRVVGLFVVGDDANLIALSADNLDLGTIFHEYVHEVVAANFGSARVPPWLNEGLASYFQTFRMPDERTSTFGTPRPEYLALLRSNPPIPWDEFFALDNFTLHRDAANIRPVFYAQAWALVTYLMAHAESIGDARKGVVSPASLIGALNKLDRSKLSEMLSFAGTEAAIRRFNLVGAPAQYRVTTTPISEASAYAILGDLLFRQRNPTAETFLKKAIEIDAKLAEPYTTLGQLRIRDRRFAEAKSSLEKAIAFDSRSHLSHFYYAFLLLRENLDESAMLQPLKSDVAAKIREALSRSIALNAGFAESHYLLATVEFSSGDTGVAESEIRLAVGLKPGNQNYSLLLARILLRQERIDDAIAIAEPLASGSGEARIRADAREILKNADELARAKRASSAEATIQVAGYRKPVILQYRDLTPERVSKIDRDRENYNYNIIIERPEADESHLVGYVDRVDCVDERIEFRIRSQAIRLSLSTRKFDDVRFRVAVPGTRSYAFRCGTRFPNDLAVIVYKPVTGRSASAGEIKAITFVAPDFEYLTIQELQNAPMFVVEGRPGEDISQNAEISVKEREAMEREMRETRLRDIEERLRQPQPDEDRVIGIPEMLECGSGRMKVSFKVDNSNRIFSTAITKPFDVQSFTSEAPIIETGCLAQLPQLPAVITFRKADGELISVEFVPAYFKLR
jgi:tetratricopeptide (TPR) repeat protein